jgi:hypothetical protein
VRSGRSQTLTRIYAMDGRSAAPCRDDGAKAGPVAGDVLPPVFQPSLPGKAKLALVTGLAAHSAKEAAVSAEAGMLSSGANPLAEPLRQALQVVVILFPWTGLGWACTAASTCRVTQAAPTRSIRKATCPKALRFTAQALGPETRLRAG